MHLVVPSSGIHGAMINRGLNVFDFEYAYWVRLYLSSFSLTIGMENLGLQNIQRPTTVNVSMQVTSIETEDDAPWGGIDATPWARSVYIPWNPEYTKQIEFNELYVILKPNQKFHYSNSPNAERGECQVIKVSDIKFDIPEYSAVTRTEAPTLNTFTLNGTADARVPVCIGPLSEHDANGLLSGWPHVFGGPAWPRPNNEYAILQTGEVFNEQNTNHT